MIYSFDLSKFEEGKLVARRFPESFVVLGDWICRAANDAAALSLAMRAAKIEWAPPQKRNPTDFNVEFVDQGAGVYLGKTPAGLARYSVVL